MVTSHIKELISNNPHLMRRRESRRVFARSLADLFFYWSYQDMESFIEEMRGLDLHKAEDVQVFLEFFSNAFPGVRA